MELKLQKLIDNLTTVANVQDMDANNSIVVRLSNSISAKLNVVVCSVTEPTNIILPLNVAWINLDPASQYYKKAMVRVSKEVSTLFAHTWVEALYYADVMADQYYDEADKMYLLESSNISNASDIVKGIVKLSVAPEDVANPIAVGEGDPRLTDARAPLSHVHPLQPAEALKTSTNIVSISQSAAPVAGQVLMATSDTTAAWVTLTASDIH